MRGYKRTFAVVLAFVLIFTSMPLFGIGGPVEVYASETLDIDTVSAGDHIYMGQKNVPGYEGSPYWRVLDVDTENKTALLMSEYLWGDPESFGYTFSRNRSDGRNMNTWSGSYAQIWCKGLYSKVLNRDDRIIRTSRTDSKFTTKTSTVYGTTSTYSSCKVDDHVFFLSAEEVEKYMGSRADRIAMYDNGFSGQWWLRSPSALDTDYAGYVDSMYEFSYTDVTGSFGFRPAFHLDLSKGIDAAKDGEGNWVVRESTGGSSINSATLRTGSHVYMGNRKSSGYTGLPYWRVIDVDKENNRALLLSEYLWRGDGSDASAGICFDKDGQANSGNDYPNEWQGSDAQMWCAEFYRNVLGASPAVKGVNISESGDISFGRRVLGPSSLTSSDKVFFLSGAELFEYFGTYGEADEYLVAYTHDGNNRGEANSWWLRSPVISGSDYGGAGKMDDSGWVRYGTTYGSPPVRPAFYLDLSSDIKATRDSKGDWVIDGYGQNVSSEQVSLDKASSYLAPGKTLTLKATGTSDIAFKTSNKKVATVTSKGVVKAVKPGTATITAYSKSDSSNKAVCKVTVKYRLTYKMDGGKNSPKNPEWYTGTVKLTNPQARKGWDFTGWYSDPKYKNKVTSVRNANKTLYAKWKWHSYYIKFEKNGGTGKQYFQSCRYDKTFNLPACKYSRKGYSFAGWNTKADGKGKAYADKASFSNITSADKKTVPFYAQWKLNKYSITYQGLPSGAANTNKTSYTINTATFSLKNASCPGYDFKGWFSDSKKTKKFTSIAKGSTGNKTIYSKWTPHKYTIRFNANGGTGSMSSMPCEYGKQYSLKANAYKMEDYLFTGWNTKADGSGMAYADGAAVNNLTAKSGGSITLYAQWETENLLYWPVRNDDLSPVDTVSSHPGEIVAGKPHRGIDIGAAAGTNWYSATDGTIVYVFRGCVTNGSHSHAECNPNHPELVASSNESGVVCNNGFGNGCIIRSVIDGQTYYLQYAHMDSVSDQLVEGAEISKGTYLGKVGDRGFSFGPHAHFEIDLETTPGSWWGQPVNNDPTSPECIFKYKK